VYALAFGIWSPVEAMLSECRSFDKLRMTCAASTRVDAVPHYGSASFGINSTSPLLVSMNATPELSQSTLPT
jgi:hypothetical protein